ncbi:MAG: tRNA pseudouridine(55) synthase TruB [Magnetospiraceae bacterium]
MGRRHKGLPIHGWMVIDKPAGMTSNAVVSQARRRTGAAKVGHGGTLDPLATGLLPLAFGEATKTVSYVMDGTKGYRFTVRWGIATETDDAEGAPVAESAVRPEETAIRDLLPQFVGDIDQIPPIYSAIKVGGRRAYDLARKDEVVDLAPRTVRIFSLDLVDQPDADHAVFETCCGKGTYIRALARDLARALGTEGHVAALRRTRVGPFDEKDAISLENLEGFGHSAPAERHLLPVETALDDIPALALTEPEAARIRNGQAVALLPVAKRSSLETVEQGATVCVLSGGKAVALARVVGAEIRPSRVLNI